MTKTHKCACVILNYNNWKETVEYVEKILKFYFYDMIIVVDNNSPDNSYEHMKQLISDRVIVTRLDENNGYGAGNNYGVKIAKENNCDITFISNSDIDYEVTCLKNILNCFDLYPHAAVCSAVQYNGFSEELFPSYAWMLPTYSRYLVSSLEIARRIYPSKILPLEDKYSKVDCVAGAFLAVRTDFFMDAGGYDEGIFLYCEESVLGYRLKNKLYETFVSTESKYFHFISGTISKSIPKEVDRYKLILNSRLYYIENYLKVSRLKVQFAKACFRLAVGERYIVTALKVKLNRKRSF